MAHELVKASSVNVTATGNAAALPELVERAGGSTVRLGSIFLNRPPQPGARDLPWLKERLLGGLGFEHGIDVACSVQDADDFDAVVRRTIEDQVFLETLDPPYPQPARCGLADGHRSPRPGMLAILPKVVLAASWNRRAISKLASAAR